jgi:hypothetical protein
MSQAKTGKHGVILKDGQDVCIHILGPVDEYPSVTLHCNGFDLDIQTQTVTTKTQNNNKVPNGVMITATAKANGKDRLNGDDLTVTVSPLAPVTIPTDTED